MFPITTLHSEITLNLHASFTHLERTISQKSTSSIKIYQLMCAAKILKYIQQLSTTISYGCIPGDCRQFYNQNRLFWQKNYIRPTDIVSAN